MLSTSEDVVQASRWLVTAEEILLSTAQDVGEEVATASLRLVASVSEDVYDVVVVNSSGRLWCIVSAHHHVQVQEAAASDISSLLLLGWLCGIKSKQQLVVSLLIIKCCSILGINQHVLVSLERHRLENGASLAVPLGIEYLEELTCSLLDLNVDMAGVSH